jgi:WD40 repeat protein
VAGSEPAQRLSGHEGAVLGVDISADGSRVVSAGEDGSVRLWRAANGGSGQILHSGGTSETDVAFSPDGERIAAVGDDRRVRLWDGQTGVEEKSLSGEGRQLLAVAFSADGRRFAAAGRDGVIRLWSVEGGPPVAVLRGQGARVYDVGFGPSSDRVVSAADDGTVRIWDAGRTQAWSIPSLTYDIEFNRDGRLLESSSDDGTMRVWDPATGRLRASLPGPQGTTFGRFSPTSDTLVISSSSPLVRLWPVSAPSAEVAARLPEGRSVVFASFDPTGNRIVYTDDRGRVAIRDLRSGREVTLGGTPKLVWAAEWGPDGKHIFVVPDRDVLVWDIDHPSRPQFALRGHDGSVHAMDFSQDGRILTAGEDRTARIWDGRGKQLVVMRGHEDELTTALFTADGSQVLSSSQDGSIRLFDAHTGAQLAVVQSAEGELYDVALSREGLIATLGKGEVVRVFRCEVCGSLDRVRALALSRSPRPLTAEEREQFLAATE